MNKNNLTKGLFTALLLVSSVVSADEKYPAADFQPSVVYQNDEYIKNNGSTKVAVKNVAPAAVAETKTAEVDAKYPAANFEPKVIYSDDKYQHNKSVPKSKSTSNSVSSVTEDSNAADLNPQPLPPKESSSLTYLLGLAGLAAVGFFLFRKSSPAAPKTTVSTVAPKVAANTGVAKYLNKVSGTGVSRYVEQQIKTAKSVTGVAKYVAQQTLAEKVKAAAEEEKKKSTGVEKYVRNRG